MPGADATAGNVVDNPAQLIYAASTSLTAAIAINDYLLANDINRVNGRGPVNLRASAKPPTFTRGLDQDLAAVTAALTLTHHNGRTEGVNTKTKMLK